MINQLTGEKIPDNEIRGLSELCKCQLDLEKRIAKYQAQLDLLNKEFTELSTKRIPDKMAELGVSDITLSTGESVSIKNFYAGGFQEGREQECIAWLEKHKFGGLIKRSVIRSFTGGEGDKFQKLVKQLSEKNIPFEKKEGVHPQTFKAFLRELTEKGKSLPENIFKVFVGKVTKIER